MDMTREIVRYGNRSVVEITVDGEVKKYVTCTDYDESKEIGSRWNWGHYFDIWNGCSKEEALKSAMLDLYNINENDISLGKRMKGIAERAVVALTENIHEDNIQEVLQTLELTDEEAKNFEVYDILYPKAYKVVELTLERVQTATIQVAAPKDVEIGYWNLMDYVDNADYIEPDQSDDWDVRSFDIVERDISKSDFLAQHNEEDIWNYDDVESEII